MTAKEFLENIGLSDSDYQDNAMIDHISDLMERYHSERCNVNEKPPLGLKPKWIHDQQRQGEIMAAINRYLEEGKTPPKEWAIEFASYCD